MKKMPLLSALLILPAALNLILPGQSLPQYVRDPLRIDKGKLNFDYIVMFADSLDRNRLKIFANVIYDELQFIKKDDTFNARYRFTFTILDINGEFLESKRVNGEIKVEDFFETNSRTKYQAVERDFDLPPGEYTVKLELLDYETRELKTNDRKVVIPGRVGSNLLLAGPILLDTIIIADDGSVKLTPGVSGDIFDGKDNIWVYFEVFSQEFPLELSINYRLLDSKGKVRVNGDFNRSLQGNVLRDNFSLDIDRFPFDNYRLIFTVKSGPRSVNGAKNFRIRWPELPSTIRDLDTAIEQLRYVATDKDISRLKENYPGRKLELFLRFWSKWGKNQSESSQLMEEYYRRIWESNHRFSDNGWRSDRGHVYVVHGPPDEVDRRIDDLYSRTYEVWYYIEDNKRFVFVDDGGIGTYRLQSPFWGN